ncbi:hypothetical protein [Rhodococcus cercidiphylli]|uniref:Uncharacterized protein n=1 Tax=Rhodococcus cercidiphylli TaxID=489916 RepID=A0ABU4B0C8_9NOCA|nr:hypothetical protein [Rhodococcus cercidiphylli]MDV6231942.1 hypothetical protein [Rhodococcus cercidiphylli]
MSLFIDVDTITHVLLVDGWHEVKPGSFYTDSYEFVSEVDDKGGFHTEVGGGAVPGVPHTGFQFEDPFPAAGAGNLVVGPLTAILAVRRNRGVNG